MAGAAGAAAAVGAAAAGIVGCSPSPSQAPGVVTRPRVRWQLVSSFPRNLDTIFGAAEVFRRRVKELTDERFDIQVYSAGELVGGLEVLDAVRGGSVEMGHSASYYYIGKNPALAFDTAVPFGLGSREHNAWLLEAGGLELVRGLLADFNVINLLGGNTGVQMGGWFRKSVNSLADLKGIKMRIPGLGGEVMSRLGVTVQVLAGSEIYVALERGIIDATEWVGPYDDEKLGFHQVADRYYYPGWWEPGPSLSYYINREAWAQLPTAYRTAVETAAAESASRMLMQYDARNPAALRRLVEHGVELCPFPQDVMEAARRETEALLEEQAAADAGYRKVYEHWKAFRRDSAKWLSTAELTYANFAYR